MGEVYDDRGERLEFVGTRETRIRGRVVTDKMGRWYIALDNEFGGRDIPSLLPEEIELYPDTDEKESEPFVFWIDTTAWKPTGEFKEDNG